MNPSRPWLCAGASTPFARHRREEPRRQSADYLAGCRALVASASAPGMALQNGQVLRVVVDKVTEVEGADGKDAKRAGKAAGKRRISLALDTSGVVELD